MRPRTPSNPAHALLRLAWTAGFLSNLFAGALGVAAGSVGSRAPLTPTLGLAVAVLLLAFPVRMQRYKRAWRGDAVTPTGYAAGTGLFLLLAGWGPAGLALAHPSGPMSLVAGASVLILAANFPSGAPMRPRPPRVSEAEP